MSFCGVLQWWPPVDPGRSHGCPAWNVTAKLKQRFCVAFFAGFHIFRHSESFFLAEPPKRPFSQCKSQLVPLVSLILCFQPTDHSCWRSVTPPWGQGAVKWLLSPCLVTDEACVWSPRGSHSIHEPEFAEAGFWRGWTWQILKQRIKCKECCKLLLLLSSQIQH